MKTARVTVQFQSVIEKLSPHDTIFPFAQSTDLRDSALSSACSLHTPTASIKSSNDSLSQKGLAEITEDVSEARTEPVGKLAYGGTTTDEEQVLGAEDARTRPEKVNGFTSADPTHHRSASATTQSSFRPRTTSNTDKPLPPPPFEDYTREDKSHGSTLDFVDHNTRPSMDGRFSSTSTRPSTRDLYDAYGYKKKTKMGPRPSFDSVGAPSILGTLDNDFRPVSTLPAGLRMPTRKAVPARPASREAQASFPIQTSSPVKPSPPAQANSSEKMIPKKAPTTTVTPIHIPDRNSPLPHNASRTPRISDPVSPKMTPEKQRLMKALQLRQKKLAAQNLVNDLGINNVFEEPEFTKPEIDDSILGAVIDASNSTEGPKPVPIATKDLAKEGSRLLEDSPISMPETAEEPSTQASSITDEEGALVQKREEQYPSSIASVQDQQIQSDSLHKSAPSYLTGSQGISLETSDVLTEVAVIESPRDLRQSSAPMQSEDLAASGSAAEREVTGKEAPEPRGHECSLTDEQLSNVDNIVPAEGVGRDKQLSPPIAGVWPSLVDRKTTLLTDSDENMEAQQSEPLDYYEEAASIGEALNNKHLLQSQSLKRDKRDYDANTDRHAQGEPEKDQIQLLDYPSREWDKSAPSEGQSDTVKPLLLRRSSSSKSITVPDNINAHEIPLPPIDEDEEISLSPQRALFQEHAATQKMTETSSKKSNEMDTERFISNGVGEKQTERQSRKQVVVNPIKRVSSPDQSDEQFLSDDAFMEELKSATVQEAKPVSVSKSPIKPVFSRSESEQRLNNLSAQNSRSVSSPVNQSAKKEEAFSSPRPLTPLSAPRSFSAQHAPRPDSQQSHVPISKKIGVSSSISQRIKALEQLSSRPTSPVSPKLAPNTSTFLGLRTTSLRTPSGNSDYKNNNTYKNRSDTGYPSPSPSPEPVKSNHLISTKMEHAQPSKPATTTIIHDVRKKSLENPSNPPEPRPVELNQKPLQLEIRKSPPPAEHPPLSPLKPPRPRFGRYSSTRSGSSSSNEQKLEPSSTTRRDSFASIRSKSSRAGSEVELPRTLSDSSLSGVTSLEGTQDEKKDSRRSRLLKRMSSISSMSRRSIAHALSPGPKEAPIIERQEPVQEAPSTSVDVGDVNIQFPDNLVCPPFNLLPTSAHICSSFGRGDTWSWTRRGC